MADTIPHSFAEERRAAIMSMLDRTASVQVAELARTFGVSAVTIRADLDALEADGKLRRTHGGAVSLHKTLTVSIQDKRVNVNVAAKQAIARAAIELVEDGDALLVDSGTTALEFVRMLSQRSGITVITADVTIADFIDESLPAVDAILLGGALRKGHRYTYGPLTMRSLEILHADKAIICPTAIVSGCGLMTNYAQMAEVKSGMMEAARERIVLADASKLDGQGLFRFASIADVDTVVVDADADGILSNEIASLPEGSSHPTLIVA
ncbi:DeoR family transcriptional regulator [Collinsella sp. An271]|uniref:DeoR/GlpR family DNA-binding transcription regulator n=1 Tax=Collinsella sp. An271 TaxID=1965616 RepID=UPI000B37135E|nr:DeoR/GlpR family DNA-binding transcription regulator [Collinsella sp. An271]OUO61857.1 DeoR family transcriptional regulator [Collinsella sp. An271]